MAFTKSFLPRACAPFETIRFPGRCTKHNRRAKNVVGRGGQLRQRSLGHVFEEQMDGCFHLCRHLRRRRFRRTIRMFIRMTSICIVIMMVLFDDKLQPSDACT